MALRRIFFSSGLWARVKTRVTTRHPAKQLKPKSSLSILIHKVPTMALPPDDDDADDNPLPRPVADPLSPGVAPLKPPTSPSGDMLTRMGSRDGLAKAKRGSSRRILHAAPGPHTHPASSLRSPAMLKREDSVRKKGGVHFNGAVVVADGVQVSRLSCDRVCVCT